MWWRPLVAIVVLVVLLASLSLVGGGHHCRSDGRGPTARGAVIRYYRYCRSKPEITDFGDGDKQSTGYASWHGIHEFEVVYEGGR